MEENVKSVEMEDRTQSLGGRSSDVRAFDPLFQVSDGVKDQ
jgi:hypothetical protein